MKTGQRIRFKNKGKEITGLVIRVAPGPVINKVLQWQVVLRTEGYVEKKYIVSDEGWTFAK